MAINIVQPADQGYVYGASQTGGVGKNGQDNAISNLAATGEYATPIINSGDGDQAAANNDNSQKQYDKDNLEKVTQGLSSLMESLNTNIHFKLYDKTNQLMVQVIDEATQKVLKEFPPHQLLDTIAAIRDRIGVLLDKRV